MSGTEQRGQLLAEAFREEYGLDDVPLKDMHALVHAALGVDVLSMKRRRASTACRCAIRSPAGW